MNPPISLINYRPPRSLSKVYGGCYQKQIQQNIKNSEGENQTICSVKPSDKLPKPSKALSAKIRNYFNKNTSKYRLFIFKAL